MIRLTNPGMSSLVLLLALSMPHARAETVPSGPASAADDKAVPASEPGWATARAQSIEMMAGFKWLLEEGVRQVDPATKVSAASLGVDPSSIECMKAIPDDILAPVIVSAIDSLPTSSLATLDAFFGQERVVAYVARTGEQMGLVLGGGDVPTEVLAPEELETMTQYMRMMLSDDYQAVRVRLQSPEFNAAMESVVADSYTQCGIRMPPASVAR